MPYYAPFQPGYMPGYQPTYTQPVQYQQQNTQPVINNPANIPAIPQDVGGASAGNPMMWVQGEAGAKAFMVAPGNTVVLWDSEENVIYIKSADPAGMPYMRIFDYTERNSAPRIGAAQPNPQYVTREEFNALTARINQMTTPVMSEGEVNHAE